MTARAEDDHLVWLDLEMTGLDLEQHTIVEIACIVTDSNLTLLDDGIDIVIHQDAETLARMDDFVRKMHTKSALLPAISASEVSLETAQVRTVDYIRAHVPSAGVAPLCGNSIGTDRRFLDRYMHDLDTYLHYRSVDVSSLKELCRRWFPEIYARRPDKSEQHRALDDIKESIEELRFYRAELFIPAASAAADSAATSQTAGSPSGLASPT
jgi:oligoribonuclease